LTLILSYGDFVFILRVVEVCIDF